MAQKTRDRLLLTLAWIIVPIAFGIYIFASYRYALSNGRLPYSDGNEWVFWAVYGSSLALGVLSIFSTAGGNRGGKTLFSACYLAIMGAVLFLMWFLIACQQGDCL